MQINYLPPSIFGPFVEYWRYWLMPIILTLVTFVTVVLTIIVCSDFYEKFKSRSILLPRLAIIVVAPIILAIGLAIDAGVILTMSPKLYELDSSSPSTLSMAPYHANLDSPEHNAKRATYSQKDYDIGPTDQVKSLYEVDGDRYIHPLVEGWYDVGQGKIKGSVSTPQGKVLGLKHGDPSSQFVQLRYETQGEQKTAIITLSDDQFVKLYQYLSNHFNPTKRKTYEKPIGISELENGDLVIDNYSN